MLCKEIIQVIEASYPKEAALEFDNVGLLAGRLEKEVSKVYLALDATEDCIRNRYAYYASSSYIFPNEESDR